MEMTLTRQMPLRCLEFIQSSIGTRHADTGRSSSCLPFSRIGSAEKVFPVLTFKRVSSVHGRRRLSCRSYGRSRRDDAKIVATIQRRRSRYGKGVSSTKPERFDKLQADDEAYAGWHRLQASADSDVGTGTGDDSEKSAEDLSDSGVKIVENGDDTYTVQFTPEGKRGSEDAGEAVQNTIEDVSATAGDTADDISDTVQDVSTTAGDTADDVSGTVQDASQESQKSLSEAGDKVQDNVEDAAEGVGEDARDVSNVAQDTAGDVSGIAQDAASNVSQTVQSSAQDVTNIARDGGGGTTKRRRKKATPTSSNPRGVEEVVPAEDSTYAVKYYPEGEPPSQVAESGAEDAAEVAGKVSGVAGDTAEELSSTAQSTVDETGKSLGEAADRIQGDVQEGTQQVQKTAEGIGEIGQGTLEDVAQTAQRATGEVGELIGQATTGGREAAEEGADAVGEQLQEGRKEAEENLTELRVEVDKAGERARTGLDKVSDEAAKSFRSVQESVFPLADSSANVAETLRTESTRLGEVILNVAGEALGLQGSSDQQESPQGTYTQQSVGGKTTSEAAGSKNGSTGTPEIQGAKSKPSQPEGSKDKDKDLYKGLKVAVAGASGRTGRLLVEELASKGVQVTALVRDKRKSESQAWAKLSGVEVVEADLYKYETIKKSLGDSNVVISAIGARSFPFDPIGTYQAEFEGVKNLVAAAKNKGDVKKFVFITSLGVTYLQIVPLIFWKKQSELYLQRSGLDYTIVRPGGLTSGSKANEVVQMKPADTQFGGSISRKKVAEVSVAAIITPEASEKIVEVVSGGGASRSYADLFGSV